MKKELGENLPISGWLILTAVGILSIMNTAFSHLLKVIGNVIISAVLNPGQPMPETTPPTAYIVGFVVVALPLSVYAALLFFQRKKAFIWFFIGLDIVNYAFNFITYFSLRQINYDMSLSEMFNFAVTFVLCGALIIYFFFSRRVKKTFLYDLKDKTYKEKQGPPYMIYGFLIVVILRLSDIIFSSFFTFFAGLFGIINTFSIKDLTTMLIYGAACAFGIFTIILCFHRRKLFKWAFLLLAGAFFAWDMYKFIHYITTTPMVIHVPWFFYIPTAIYYTYYAAVILYMLFSRKRVPNTFVYGLKDKLEHHEKLISNGLFPMDEDAEEEDIDENPVT